MKKLLLYLLRWQLSTPIIALCLMLIPCGYLVKTVIANLIGGLIFYKVDKLIFKKGTKDKDTKMIKNTIKNNN